MVVVERHQIWDLQDLKIIVSLMQLQVLDTDLGHKGRFLEIAESEQHQTRWAESRRNKV